MDDEEQSRVLAVTYCGLTPLSIPAGILVYRKWIKKHQTSLFKSDTVLDLIDIGLLYVPDEPLSVIVRNRNPRAKCIYVVWSPSSLPCNLAELA